MTDQKTHTRTGERVVIRPADFGTGAPMEVSSGVRDKKVIYPETGFEAATLCLGLVEIDPGKQSPLHRHRCEEVYYVVEGSGELEQDGQRFPVRAGDAVLNRVNTEHRVWNTGRGMMRMVVVAGIMLVPLLPQWPTASPYEILEGGNGGGQ